MTRLSVSNWWNIIEPAFVRPGVTERAALQFWRSVLVLRQKRRFVFGHKSTNFSPAIVQSLKSYKHLRNLQADTVVHVTNNKVPSSQNT